MRFSQTTEYALRIAACLARQEDGGFTTSSDLARSASVPRSYVSKILRRLVEAGLLDSVKGHGGGFRLSRAPSGIRFIDILTAVGFSDTTEACVFGWDECSASEPCPLHPFWSRVKADILGWATESTLADVGTQDDPRAGLPG